MRSEGMMILLSMLGFTWGNEAKALDVEPDFSAGVRFAVPFPKAPVRVGVELRGGPYFYDWNSSFLARIGGSTFVDAGTNGVRFGLVGYAGGGWGDDWQPAIAVDLKGGFVVGSSKAPNGWLVGAQVEGGRILRGAAGYERVMSFKKENAQSLEYLSLGLGINPRLSTMVVIGRPLRQAGEAGVSPVLAVRFREATTEADTRLSEAREELAAVSTFIRTALELRDLGAPRALIQRCLQAAREEVHHMVRQLGLSARAGLAETCLGLIDPAPRVFTTRKEALCSLALESWVDGWHGERQAVEVLRNMRDQEKEDGIAHIWNQIGDEELSHARLSGDIVDWCVTEGGTSVRETLRAA